MSLTIRTRNSVVQNIALLMRESSVRVRPGVPLMRVHSITAITSGFDPDNLGSIPSGPAKLPSGTGVQWEFISPIC